MGKIYTRKGDKGETFLFNGKRVSKADSRIEVLGTIDELNSAIGVTIAELLMIKDPHFAKAPRGKKGLMIKKELIKIQLDLLEIGAALASTQVSSQKLAVSSLLKRVRELEGLIDEMTEQMPKLSNFILPGGGRAGAMLHLARAVCRRAERRLAKLSQKSEVRSQKLEVGLITYFNRLSDLLFTMARFVNFKEKKKEQIWPND